jgi:hypothetical protein
VEPPAHIEAGPADAVKVGVGLIVTGVVAVAEPQPFVAVNVYVPEYDAGAPAIVVLAVEAKPAPGGPDQL